MSALKELRSRVIEFFRSQPRGEAVGLELLAREITADDLKNLVPDEMAETAVEEAVKAKYEVPADKAARKHFGRTAVLTNTLEDLTKEKILEKQKSKDIGLGWAYLGPRRPDSPEGQKGKLKSLPIDSIRVDNRIQQREDGINEETVNEYAQVAELLPPARVFVSKGEDGKELYILSRGFHRVRAWKQAGWDMVPCEVYEGDREDALADAAGDNATHGRRRTKKDIAKAIETLARHKTFKHASTALIAETVGIAWQTADRLLAKARSKIKAEKESAGEKADEASDVVVGKGGKKTKRKIKKKAATAKPAPVVETPPKDAPVATSGIKDKTGADVPQSMAAPFMDNRFPDSLRSMQQLIEYLRDLRTDGHAVSSIDVKARTSILGEIETKVETLRLSMPYAAIPNGAALETAILRRGWMNAAEFKAWEKAGKKLKTGPAAEPAPAPAAEPAPATSQNETTPASPPA